MSKSVFTIVLSAVVFISACSSARNNSEEVSVSDLKAQQIVDKAIELHGGDLVKSARIEFTFRGKRHLVIQNDSSYRYERTFKEEGRSFHDVYLNGLISRRIDGEEIELSGREKSRYIEDLNSVSYFALLPHKLNDRAVIKKYLGQVDVKGKSYDKIQVTFKTDGGGDSPDNIFVYWFDQNSGMLEYLGYTKGGHRFRAGYNLREVNGIYFLDYVNFKSDGSEADEISSYDKLYEAGKLKELSRIILEDISVTHLN